MKDVLEHAQFNFSALEFRDKLNLDLYSTSAHTLISGTRIWILKATLYRYTILCIYLVHGIEKWAQKRGMPALMLCLTTIITWNPYVDKYIYGIP